MITLLKNNFGTSVYSKVYWRVRRPSNPQVYLWCYRQAREQINGKIDTSVGNHIKWWAEWQFIALSTIY